MEIVSVLMGLVILTTATYSLGRSPLYPAFAYSAVWLFNMTTIIFAGSSFYPLRSQTLLIVLLGASSFAAGGVVAEWLNMRGLYVSRRNTGVGLHQPLLGKVGGVFVVLLAILSVIFPFFVMYTLDLARNVNVDNIALAIRYQTSVRLEDSGGFGPFAYIVNAASVIALAAVVVRRRLLDKRHKYVTAALVILAFGFQLATFARTGAFVLTVGLLVCSLLGRAAIPLRALLVAGLSAIALFIGSGVATEKMGTVSGTVGDNVVAALATSQLYAVGGIVALDVATHEGLGDHGLTTFRFFAKLLGAIGFEDNSALSLVLPYVLTPRPTNVYSGYYLYYNDFGLAGIAAIPFVIGIVLTLLYRAARRREGIALLMYGILFPGILLTGFTEIFISSISAWIQAILIGGLVLHPYYRKLASGRQV